MSSNALRTVLQSAQHCPQKRSALSSKELSKIPPSVNLKTSPMTWGCAVVSVESSFLQYICMYIPLNELKQWFLVVAWIYFFRSKHDDQTGGIFRFPTVQQRTRVIRAGTNYQRMIWWKGNLIYMSIIMYTHNGAMILKSLLFQICSGVYKNKVRQILSLKLVLYCWLPVSFRSLKTPPHLLYYKICLHEKVFFTMDHSKLIL